MPGMDGLTVAAAIKADPAIRDTVVILLTSIGNRSESGGAESACIDGYLVKPARQSHLLNALADAWARRVEMDATEFKPPQPSEIVVPRPPETPSGAPIRVLVAEDNVVNQRVAIRMLERLGLRADMAANGREAVQMFDLLPYDVIFMDCQMPEMNGYEAAREIRRRENGGRRIPIIAMTADTIAGCREECLASGMDDFVNKPVTLSALTAIVRRWVPSVEAMPKAT